MARIIKAGVISSSIGTTEIRILSLAIGDDDKVKIGTEIELDTGEIFRVESVDSGNNYWLEPLPQ